MASLIEALIQQESGGNPRALNPRTGAMGLMQVMPDTARNPGFGVKPLTDPWNADENKRFGTEYLGAMQKRYPGDQDAALAAYNWGPGNADKWVASGKTSPLPAETRNYIRNINAMAGGGQERPQERAQMPDPFQPPRPQAPQMPTPGNSMVPGILGGGDEPGYFGRLMSDPTFLTGASVLSGGLAGQAFGPALQQGTQAGVAANEAAIRRQKHAAWGRIFGKDGPNLSAPLLKGVPPDLIPIVQAMGPDDGMDALTKLAFKRMAPHQLTSVAPGASLYDETAKQEVYRAPMTPEKPPAGFRSVEGGNLEAIPGGPATQIPGDQAGRLAAIQTAESSFQEAKQYFAGMGFGRINKVLNRGDAGRAERTVKLAVESALRAMTGAAAPPAEVENYTNLFAPSAWDTGETMADKLSRLESFIGNAKANLQQGRGAAPQQPQRPPQGMPGAPGGQGKTTKDMSDDELWGVLGGR